MADAPVQNRIAKVASLAQALAKNESGVVR